MIRVTRVIIMTAEPESTLRLFFALHADGVRKSLRDVHRYLNNFTQKIKTVSPDHYHITLKFLGETRYDIFEKLRDDFKNTSFEVPPLVFKLKGLGGFPDGRRAGVIWCGISGDEAGIGTVYRSIEALTEKHGFKKETRAFYPHFTLARTRKDERLPPELAHYLAENKDTFYGEVRFSRIVLFRSDLRRDGPVYTALAEMRL
ncbi:MAG: 2'-5' RNA ligase [Spirochaetes bacterium RBG_16_49_21]|nr:MAG: 2'-5' RNA ligase [Spirochaetes bacterium RBG_16_49_21]